MSSVNTSTKLDGSVSEVLLQCYRRAELLEVMEIVHERFGRIRNERRERDTRRIDRQTIDRCLLTREDTFVECVELIRGDDQRGVRREGWADEPPRKPPRPSALSVRTEMRVIDP